MTFQELLLGGILVVLILIYNKLTERQRLAKRKQEEIDAGHQRKAVLKSKAWNALSEEDKAKFNDFHYEHAIGKISNSDYEAMKLELSQKTHGLHS